MYVTVSHDELLFPSSAASLQNRLDIASMVKQAVVDSIFPDILVPLLYRTQYWLPRKFHRPIVPAKGPEIETLLVD